MQTGGVEIAHAPGSDALARPWSKCLGQSERWHLHWLAKKIVKEIERCITV